MDHPAFSAGFHSRVTRWIHPHIASPQCTPSREQRLAWHAPVRGQKDDGTAPRAASPIASNEGGLLTPEELALGINPRNKGTGVEPAQLLEQLEDATKSQSLDAFIEHARDRILLTTKGKGDVWALKRMLDGEIPSNPKMIRIKIEELLKPAAQAKEEEDKIVRGLMAQTRESVATVESGEGKQTRWEEFLDMLGRLTNPLHRRLAHFLQNPSVRPLTGISEEEVCKALESPEGKLLPFLRTMAGLRHDLFFQGEMNIEDRQRALDDLFAFLTHAQHLLSPAERAELAEACIRVGMCMHALDAYAEERARRRKEQKGDEPDIPLYQARSEHIGSFFKEDRESTARTIQGTGGLIQRLEEAKRKHGGDPAFRVLADELKGGILIPQQLGEEGQYLCVLLALEEVGFLYMGIASERMKKPRDEVTLIAYVKNVLREIVGRQRSQSRYGPLPFGDILDLQQKWAEAEERMRASDTPNAADIDRLLLLVPWFERRGETPPRSREDLLALRKNADVATEELRREAASTREEAARTAESSAVRSAVLERITEKSKGKRIENLAPEKQEAAVAALLQGEDPNMRLAALYGIDEEEAFYRSARFQGKDALGEYLRTACTYEQLCRVAQAKLKRNNATAADLFLAGDIPLEHLEALLEGTYAHLRPSVEELAEQRTYAANLAIKEEKRRTREAETLHTSAEEEYARESQSILDSAEDKDKKQERMIALNQKYDTKNQSRQNIHFLQIAEWRADLLAALEAEIHLRARELREQEEHANAEIEKEENWETIKDFKGIPFARKLWEERGSTLEALHVLEHQGLQQSPYPLIEAEEALRQLAFLEQKVAAGPLQDIHDAEGNMRRGSAAAEKILQHPAAKELSEDTRTTIEAWTADDAEPEPKTINGLELFAKNPELLVITQEATRKFEERKEAIRDLSEEIADAEKRTASIFGSIRAALREKSDPYGIDLQLNRELGRVQSLLTEAKSGAHDAKNALTEAVLLLDALQGFATTISKPPETLDGDAFRAFARAHGIAEQAWGAFVRIPPGEERIVLNGKEMARHPDCRKFVLTEEYMHALHHEMKKLYPLSLWSTFRNFQEELPLDLREKFRGIALQWVPRRDDLSDFRWETEAADELLAKHAVYRRFTEQPSSTKPIAVPLIEKELAFFRELDARGVNVLPVRGPRFDDALRHEELPAAASGALGGVDDDGGIDIMDGGGSRGESANGYAEESRIPDQFLEAKKYLAKAQAFLETYPDHGPYTQENRGCITDLERRYQEAYKHFTEHEDAERDEAFKGRVMAIKNELQAIGKMIDEFDREKEDLRNVPPAGHGLQTLWRNIEWVSVFDVIRIFKDIVEDVKRQYNRRQEGKVGRVGEMITHWIPGWVPYLGNLHHDFHDRKQKAEIDEVEHFKKALENVDSFELQLMTHHTSNKDHLKALIILLVERGRINWDDTHMWETFNRLSSFEMPIKECQRNDNLREAWLRKMAADIWEDKDLYRGWKTKSDGTFKEKMQSYTPEADRLSNLKGGLSGELAKQLRIFVETKKRKEAGEHIPMDENVRPHLYMEIIDYSIRNGKMSMEDKFFYLVQGVAVGLISADRLRILAGEGGGVLNIFPFIDYFYGRNNTYPEIKALADRLLETADQSSPDYYKPGEKTTLWLSLEVAREESVQQRLRKGASKRAGEMDHDDLDFFVPRLSFKTIDQMTTPQGGGRPQVSSDGWMNAYTGYNSFFKSFGILAKLEQERLNARFTSQDAQMIVRAIAGYVRMDGNMTRRSGFGDTLGRRSSLTWGEMKSSYSVNSDKTKTVYQERATLDHFVKALLRAYNFQEGDIEDLLFSTEVESATEVKQKRCHKLSDELESRLLREIASQGTGKLKRLLLQNTETFTAHAQAGSDYNYEKVKGIWQSWYGQSGTGGAAVGGGTSHLSHAA